MASHNGGRLSERSVVTQAGHEAFPPWVGSWMDRHHLVLATLPSSAAISAALLLARPRAVVVDARDPAEAGAALALCRSLKAQPFMALVPVAVLVADDAPPNHGIAAALTAGADEALAPAMPREEADARLEALLRRSDRDTDTHPSSRLAGTRAIAEELERRVASGGAFAAGYADLDHFKEFNDRYGFPHGDRIIRLVAHMLHDIVSGVCGADGFVGHIGGDDFLFVVPRSALEPVADALIEAFDALIPWQYSEQDRRMGYYLGKDRRGQLHRIPLMTLSVAVVSNQHRRFTRGGEVSDVLTELKGYAKTLPGSVWVLDRRREPSA